MPVPAVVEITTLSSLVWSTPLENVIVTLADAVILSVVSRLAVPIFSEFVAPILALIVSFEYAPTWNSLFVKEPERSLIPLLVNEEFPYRVDNDSVWQ